MEYVVSLRPAFDPLHRPIIPQLGCDKPGHVSLFIFLLYSPRRKCRIRDNFSEETAARWQHDFKHWSP